MFDDQQPAQGGQVPGNLPIGEPEDIFAEGGEAAAVGGEKPLQLAMQADPPPVPTSPRPSALGAGALRPKSEEVEAPPSSPGAGEVYRIKEPGIGKAILIVLAVIVGVAVIGGGGWIVYRMMNPSEEAPASQEPTDITEEETPDDILEPEIFVETETGTTTATGTDITPELIDDTILFGEPIDSDGDGLDNTREIDTQTNPNNWDTDGDDLSDGDEVIIWKTDPLNKDTDGDTYLDGQEVKAGYSPTGPGKIFTPPATRENTSTGTATSSQ